MQGDTMIKYNKHTHSLFELSLFRHLIPKIFFIQKTSNKHRFDSLTLKIRGINDGGNKIRNIIVWIFLAVKKFNIMM